jgi:hypothetical protein
MKWEIDGQNVTSAPLNFQKCVMYDTVIHSQSHHLFHIELSFKILMWIVIFPPANVLFYEKTERSFDTIITVPEVESF